MVYFANFNLESATAQGARLIRTGQAQTQGFNATQFKTEVCKHITAPITCDGLNSMSAITRASAMPARTSPTPSTATAI